MKKTFIAICLLPLLNIYAANAQNVEQALKKKKDSIQNATVNGAINDPVGSASKLISLFGKKPKPNPAGGAAAPGGDLPPVNATPANIVPNNSGPSPVTPAVPATGTLAGHTKTLNNGLSFAILQVTGDKASQTVTISFKLTNVTKPNQAVVVGSLSQYSDVNPGFSIDDNGNKLSIDKVTFGGQSAKHVTTELPSNIGMKGTITLINAMAGATTLQYFKIPIACANVQGGTDPQGTLLEDRDIPIVWQ